MKKLATVSVIVSLFALSAGCTFDSEDASEEGLEGMDDEMLARRALKLTRRNRERLPRQRTVILLRQRGFGEDTIERIISDCPGKD